MRELANRRHSTECSHCMCKPHAHMCLLYNSGVMWKEELPVPHIDAYFNHLSLAALSFMGVFCCCLHSVSG